MAFAERLIEHNSVTTEERINFAYLAALSRNPQPAELKFLIPMIQRQLIRFEKNPKTANELIKGIEGWKPSEKTKISELAAWFYIANVLLNLDETITKN